MRMSLAFNSINSTDEKGKRQSTSGILVDLIMGGGKSANENFMEASYSLPITFS